MKNCPTCQASYPNTFAVCPQDGTALVEVGAWSDGTVIRGKYRVLSKVGQGGMGAVYKALHLAFDEVRALKVMSPELMSDELFVKRFKHEAVITRRLQHPNAVRVDDIDEGEDARPFIVMEYIEGQSLKKLIQDQGPLPVPRVCSIIKQVASALEAAHQLGMIHRDIKPDNIVLVAQDPQSDPAAFREIAKVLDFGIAKVKEARLGETAGLTLTGTGVVIGTPQYMSPEQAMGKRGDELDGRSDIYSLGIVMYQMLTGDLPFKADTTMEMLLAHMQKAPTPIGTLRPDLQVPDAIAKVVMKTLEKNRELRPGSAKALAEEIDRAERELTPLGATRVMPPTVLVSPRALEAAQAGAAGRPGGAARGVAAGREAAPVPPAAPTTQPRVVAPSPAPRSSPVAAAAPPRESRWGLWVSIVILVVGLGGGAWYFTARRAPVAPSSSSVEPTLPAVRPAEQGKRDNSPAKSDAGQGSSSTSPEAGPGTPATNTTPSGSPSTSAAGTATAGSRTSQTASRRESGGPRGGPSPSKPSVDPKKISGAIAMGDLYYDRGEYNDAIREYQNGLNLDPSSTDLRNKLQRAQKAKAAEERVLQ